MGTWWPSSQRNPLCVCVCVHACVFLFCSYSVLSHRWAGHADRNRVLGGPATGAPRGTHWACSEKHRKGISCYDRTEPGTLVTQHFMSPSFFLSLTCASPSASIFTFAQLLMSPSENHSYSFVGLHIIFPFTLHLVFFCDLSDLITSTPLKTTNTYADVHVHIHIERERETRAHKSFLPLFRKKYLCGEVEDNGRHVVKFKSNKSFVDDVLLWLYFKGIKSFVTCLLVKKKIRRSLIFERIMSFWCNNFHKLYVNIICLPQQLAKHSRTAAGYTTYQWASCINRVAHSYFRKLGG